MKIGDKVIGKFNFATDDIVRFRKGVLKEVDRESGSRFMVDHLFCFEAKPVIRRSWSTTQADIDCKGIY
jgi:hypothetical protein